jgi:hypothetical protein
MGTSARRTSPVISASEIGQYTYCANAWHLQRQGHEPESPLLDQGTQLHQAHGKTIQTLEKRDHRASRALAAGILIFLIAILILLLGVIL